MQKYGTQEKDCHREKVDVKAWWSSGMILALGARGSGFDPRSGPFFKLRKKLQILSAVGPEFDYKKDDNFTNF